MRLYHVTLHRNWRLSIKNGGLLNAHKFLPRQNKVLRVIAIAGVQPDTFNRREDDVCQHLSTSFHLSPVSTTDIATD